MDGHVHRPMDGHVHRPMDGHTADSGTARQEQRDGQAGTERRPGRNRETARQKQRDRKTARDRQPEAEPETDRKTQIYSIQKENTGAFEK